ncbi:hypothetical protein D6D01_10392 [Aureobasidium pullulans]|uniref:HAT C-terminal dimerisation domain-containing protein n=1 Tax=Aureobasidium pullulans TaxID=5580 RepID=A0A4S9JIC2_AURPU|nr:hypothetical protein D6D01_10392 [Aureobasidium pullulans]
MPPSKSPAARQFHESTDDENKPCYCCSWCMAFTLVGQSVKRRVKHLISCTPFHEHVKRVFRSDDEGARMELLHMLPEDLVRACREPVLAEEELDEERGAPAARSARIELKFAKAVFRSGMPLSSFDNDSWKDFFRDAAQFKPPPRARLAGELLDKVYEEVKKEVNEVIETQGAGNYTLNFISDESDAMNKDRITNLSLNTSDGQSFHITTVATGSSDHSARLLFDGLLARIREVTKGNLKRWNSLCTDTCATQRRVHELVSQHPETQHVFTVLCDAHGLQLLIKDLCHGSKSDGFITYYKKTLTEANLMSGFLRAANKLHALLVERAGEDSRKLRAFALAVITRWGTQFSVVDALIENKQLLQSVSGQFAFFNSETGQKVLNLITNEDFWLRLEHLHSLLLPIHNAQIASESDRSTVAMVIPRWKDLRSDINDISELPYKDEVLRRLDRRLIKQTSGIHWAAYALNAQAPESYKAMATHEWQLAEQFFETTIPSHLHDRFFTQFSEFRGRKGRFSSAFLQKRAHNPDSFWDYAQQYDASELCELALRLLSTPANSVPSERSFSSFNFIQNSFRTRLSTHRTDLLLYIYVNSRALDAQPWLEAQKRERLKRRREINLAEGHARKKLRLELLESLTTPTAQALAPWNITTDEAIERHLALVTAPEHVQSYLNDDDDNTLQGHVPQSLSTNYFQSSFTSSTPLLPSTPPPLPSFSQMSTQGESALLSPLRVLPQPVDRRYQSQQFKQSYSSQPESWLYGGPSYTQQNTDLDDFENYRPANIM